MSGSSPFWRSRTFYYVAALTLLALLLRLWQLDGVPPGWRDDELINSLVISQKVLDGDFALYYPDASGHEALYHALNAIMLGIFGPSVPGIRWLSAILGTLAVPLTYLVGRHLFDRTVGLTAAALLVFSFWSLMYSRIGLRHILTPVLVLGAFYFFWTALTTSGDSRRSIRDFLLAALFVGFGFYTYFAGRGVPLILLAFCGYLLLFARQRLRDHGRGLLLMFVVILLLALPLAMTLSQQPESEARVAELAVPLVEARAGNFEPLVRHVRVTLSMFHSGGDDEWLYNIPHRPLFGPLGAIFFWSGVALALWYSLQPLAASMRDRSSTVPASQTSQASAFLLLWWLAGISPGFISVPPASLGHTILAQPAVFLLAALPIWRVSQLSFSRARWLALGAALLLVASVAVRDLPAYFQEWPQRGMVRFLYRAEIAEVADYLNANGTPTDFGITGLLAGPWDKVALAIDLEPSRAAAVKPRWYDPQRAVLIEPALSFSGYPDVENAYAAAHQALPDAAAPGAYRLKRLTVEAVARLSTAETICFVNGLCAEGAHYDAESGRFELSWSVASRLDLPAASLISNPPPPGVYAGPRLYVFAQVLDTAKQFVSGDDGLWVDPYTLQPGDRFMQQHWLPEAATVKDAVIAFGLYDPLTGERISTTDGSDHVRLEVQR